MESPHLVFRRLAKRWGEAHFGSALFPGAGVFSANIRRTQLGVQGTLLDLVAPWTCMKELHNFLFYTGEVAGAIMLFFVSLDRFLAIKLFAWYRKLGMR